MDGMSLIFKKEANSDVYNISESGTILRNES